MNSARQLELLRNGKVIRVYRVCLGSNPIGAKERQGDGKTPEGIYRIDSRNAGSQFHRALHVSYPNAADRSRARRLHVSPGGEIMIHGVPNRWPARELDPLEIRILGCLMEKQLATPEYYPLTLNALVTACNQKSNREPVMEVGESDIQRALDRLQDEKLVWKVLGGRATRWDHNLDLTWHLDRPAKAILALLFLRGAQTPGELRGRSDRLHGFETIDDVESTLQRLGHGDDALLRELPRRSGQKETRWMHRLGGAYV